MIMNGLMVRDYRPQDYREICRWWEDRGIPVTEECLLPGSGTVACLRSKDGKIPLVAAFLYKTDSRLGFIENLVCRPGWPVRSEMNKAIDMTVVEIIRRAKEKGMTALYGNTTMFTVATRARAHGFNTKKSTLLGRRLT